MSDERDPTLESLFARAERDLVDDSYTAQVMAKIHRRRRHVMIGRLGMVAVVVAFELLLSAPLQTSVGMVTEALSTTLISLENEWLALAVAP